MPPGKSWIFFLKFPGPGCRRRRLNQGLAVALDFLSVLVLDRACFFVLIFWFLGACFV